jgi:hypothetical protein
VLHSRWKVDWTEGYSDHRNAQPLWETALRWAASVRVELSVRAPTVLVDIADSSSIGIVEQLCLHAQDRRWWSFMVRIADISWAKKLLAISGFYALGLLSVGLVGGYTINYNSATTESALGLSQTRAHATGAAQVAILTMGRAQAQLLSATDPDARRTAAIAAIGASSALDESIQRLQEALSNNTKVAELSQLLQDQRRWRSFRPCAAMMTPRRAPQ